MTVESVGLDFFRVALNALKNSRLIRLIRILENDSQTASFWYLLNSNEALLRRKAKIAHLDLAHLKSVSEKLLGIRNKTFVHIDREGVFDPQSYYEAAHLSHHDLETVIEGLWLTMKGMHREVLGKDLEYDEYEGTDILSLAKLRDGASA